MVFVFIVLRLCVDSIGSCLLSVTLVGVMLSKVFVSDCTKVLRGATSVASAAVSIQAAKLKLFMELVGLNSCVENLDNMRFRRSCSTGQKCCIPPEYMDHNTFPDFSTKSRHFSTSAADSTQPQKKKKALSSSKQRHVPASRIGRAAGFGSN